MIAHQTRFKKESVDCTLEIRTLKRRNEEIELLKKTLGYKMAVAQDAFNNFVRVFCKEIGIVWMYNTLRIKIKW